MRIGQIGRELRLLVVDLDADDARLPVRGDAHELRELLAQLFVGLEIPAILQVEAIGQRALHAVALQQCDVQLVGRLRRHRAGQSAERAERRERRGRLRLLLRNRRQQAGARGVLVGQQHGDQRRDDRGGRGDAGDPVLAFAEPGQHVEHADRRAVVELLRRGRQIRFGFESAHWASSVLRTPEFASGAARRLIGTPCRTSEFALGAARRLMGLSWLAQRHDRCCAQSELIEDLRPVLQVAHQRAAPGFVVELVRNDQRVTRIQRLLADAFAEAEQAAAVVAGVRDGAVGAQDEHL